MSDAAYSIVAAFCLLASIVGIWSAIRRRQLTRRLLRSLTAEQRRVLGLDGKPGDPES